MLRSGPEEISWWQTGTMSANTGKVPRDGDRARPTRRPVAVRQCKDAGCARKQQPSQAAGEWIALLELMDRDRKGKTEKESVHGKQPETFFLCLDQQQCVERVLVSQRYFEITGGMTHGYRHECHVQFFQYRDDTLGRKATLAFTRSVTGIVLEAHFPNRNSVDMDICPVCCERPAFWKRGRFPVCP